MHAWLISEIYFDPITDSQFREIINNYTVILVATIRRSKIKRLRLSSFPSKLLLSGGKVDRCFHDLVYVLQFFFPFISTLFCSVFSSPPFLTLALAKLFDALLSHEAGREAGEKNGSAIFLACISSQLHRDGVPLLLRQLFLRTVFPFSALLHSPFFHRPQSFSATFRFASRRRYTEKCNKWLLFVNRHKASRIEALSD